MKLKEILALVGLGDAKQAVLKRLQNALDHEEGRRGGEMLGRALCESVDSVMEAHNSQITPEQTIAVGTALAEQMAAELEAAAATLRAYAPLQAGVVRAKTTGGDLAAARKARNAGTSDVKSALATVVPEG